MFLKKKISYYCTTIIDKVKWYFGSFGYRINYFPDKEYNDNFGYQMNYLGDKEYNEYYL